jgi:hypothetical protein
MKPGTQIIYIPSHAEGDPNHPDCKLGFVISQREDISAHFCRYWSKGKPGKELRTTANSELTPDDCLREWPVLTDKEVYNWILKIVTNSLHQTKEGQ